MHHAPDLPSPCERKLVFLVREAWPSGQTAANVVGGELWDGDALRVTSEMNEDGVVFGDGVETDHITLPYGQSVELAIAERSLSLCIGG